MITERDLLRLTLRSILFTPHAPEALRERVTLRSAVSSRDTRATTDHLLQLPRVRTEFARKSFIARSIRSWNAMPCDIRESSSSSLAVFKSSLESYLSH